MNAQLVSVEMTVEKQCKGSVKFSTKEKQPNALLAVDNIYVSRIMPGINEAKAIRVTVEILN